MMHSDLETELSLPDAETILVWSMRRILLGCPGAVALERLWTDRHGSLEGPEAWGRLCAFLNIWRAFPKHGIVINPPPVEFRSADEQWLVQVWRMAAQGRDADLDRLLARRIASCACDHACQLLLRRRPRNARLAS